MKHDLPHEEHQNAAIRLLAAALHGLGADCGKSHYKHIVAQVEAALNPDGSEPAPAQDKVSDVDWVQAKADVKALAKGSVTYLPSDELKDDE